MPSFVHITTKLTERPPASRRRYIPLTALPHSSPRFPWQATPPLPPTQHRDGRPAARQDLSLLNCTPALLTGTKNPSATVSPPPPRCEPRPQYSPPVFASRADNRSARSTHAQWRCCAPRARRAHTPRARTLHVLPPLSTAWARATPDSHSCRARADTRRASRTRSAGRGAPSRLLGRPRAFLNVLARRGVPFSKEAGRVGEWKLLGCAPQCSSPRLMRIGFRALEADVRDRGSGVRVFALAANPRGRWEEAQHPTRLYVRSSMTCCSHRVIGVGSNVSRAKGGCCGVLRYRGPRDAGLYLEFVAHRLT